MAISWIIFRHYGARLCAVRSATHDSNLLGQDLNIRWSFALLAQVPRTRSHFVQPIYFLRRSESWKVKCPDPCFFHLLRNNCRRRRCHASSHWYAYRTVASRARYVQLFCFFFFSVYVFDEQSTNRRRSYKTQCPLYTAIHLWLMWLMCKLI